MLCVLRWVENPRDTIAAFRVVQLLPGIGPATARETLAHLSGAGWDFVAPGAFRALQPDEAWLGAERLEPTRRTADSFDAAGVVDNATAHIIAWR